MRDPFDRPARPWDLWNKNIGRVETVVAQERLAICKACPFYTKAGTCSECGCLMFQKVKLPNAECPQHKWEQVTVSFKEDQNG